MPINAGFARVDITPPLGCEIPGGFMKNYAKSVHDPLYARAAWLDDGRTAIAICSVDCCFTEAPCVTRARQKAVEFTGRQVEMLMAATHTHSGGPTADVLMSESDPRYLDWVADQTASAVALAAQSAEPASLKTAVGEAPGVAFNRRFRMKDGSVKTNPGYGNASIAECLGPADPGVGVIGAYDEFGESIGAVVNFTCHSTFMSGADYSGDYAAWIENRMGVPTVFLPGAIGDINQCDFVNGSRDEAFGESAACRAGTQVAEAALRALAGEAADAEAALGVAAGSVTLPLRGPSAEQLENARQLWEAEGDLTQEKIYARELILLDEIVSASPRVECELQAIRIGDMRIGAVPVQPFCQIGLNAKRGMGKMMFAGLANGHLAYVGLEHNYDEIGYELELKRTSRLAPGSGEMIVEALREVVGGV